MPLYVSLPLSQGFFCFFLLFRRLSLSLALSLSLVRPPSLCGTNRAFAGHAPALERPIHVCLVAALHACAPSLTLPSLPTCLPPKVAFGEPDVARFVKATNDKDTGNHHDPAQRWRARWGADPLHGHDHGHPAPASEHDHEHEHEHNRNRDGHGAAPGNGEQQGHGAGAGAAAGSKATPSGAGAPPPARAPQNPKRRVVSALVSHAAVRCHTPSGGPVASPPVHHAV